MDRAMWKKHKTAVAALQSAFKFKPDLSWILRRQDDAVHGRKMRSMISHYATELQNKAMPEEYETQAIRKKEAITLAWNLMARTTNIDEVSFSVLHRVGDALQDLGLVAEDFGAHSPRKGAGSHRDSRRPNMGWALDQILEKYTTTTFRVGLDREGGYVRVLGVLARCARLEDVASLPVLAVHGDGRRGYPAASAPR